jgi:O-antigen/teichoic acid export membrane protein
MIQKKWHDVRDLFRSTDSAEVGRFSIQLRNIGHLLTGNFLSAAVAVAAMALAARAIGPTNFGILALGMALTQAMERLLSFQTWQPLIKYGSDLMESGRRDDYRQLIKVTLLLDVSTALVGWLLAVSIILVGGERFGWSEQSVLSGLIYSCVLLTAINGSPIGVLRLAGRFKDIAYLQFIGMSVRLVFSVIGFLLEWGLIGFTLIWAGTTMLSAVMLLVSAAYSLKREGLLDFFGASVSGVSEKFQGFWNFTIGANVSLIVRSAPQQFDTLIVGALTGPTGAGFYHIAKRFGKFAEQAGLQVQAVVYPDIAKLWARGDHQQIRRIFLRTEISMMLLCALGVALTILVAPTGLRLLVGPEYIAASPLVVLQICAISLMLVGSTARSGVLAAGHTNALLVLSSVCAVVFFAFAMRLVPEMGPQGANIAHIVQQGVFLIGVTILFRRASRALSVTPPRVVDPAPGE